MATAESHGFTLSEQRGQATAVIVADDQLCGHRGHKAANPGITWVQLPYAGVETFLPVARKYPDVTFTSAKGSYAPPVAEHALALTLALLRHLPDRIRATSWGTSYGSTLDGANVVIVGGWGIG